MNYKRTVIFFLLALIPLLQFPCIGAENVQENSVGFLKLPETEEDEEEIITEISFGTEDGKNPILVYISPSCIHCAKFVVEDFKKVVNEYKDKRKFILKLLPTSAKDIFIMKIIQNECKDENGFFIIFENYIKRCLATINSISPTKEQIEKFKGSKVDPEMIKFQVEASEFGFSDEKIIDSIPDMDGDYEIKLLKFYKDSVETISKNMDSKDVELPLIMSGKTVYKTLEKALRN